MPVTREKSQLMSASEIDRTLVRLAHEVLEAQKDLDNLAFIGIRRRGVPLAPRLAEKIKTLEKIEDSGRAFWTSICIATIFRRYRKSRFSTQRTYVSGHREKTSF